MYVEEVSGVILYNRCWWFLYSLKFIVLNKAIIINIGDIVFYSLNVCMNNSFYQFILNYKNLSKYSQ